MLPDEVLNDQYNQYLNARLALSNSTLLKLFRMVYQFAILNPVVDSEGYYNHFQGIEEEILDVFGIPVDNSTRLPDGDKHYFSRDWFLEELFMYADGSMEEAALIIRITDKMNAYRGS